MIKCNYGKVTIEGKAITILAETEIIVQKVAELISDFPDGIKDEFRNHIEDSLAVGFGEKEDEEDDEDDDDGLEKMLDDLIKALTKKARE